MTRQTIHDSHEEQDALLKAPEAAVLKRAREIKTDRAVKRKRDREKQRQKDVQHNHPLLGRSYELMHCEFAEVEAKGTAAAIITDPPYGKDAIPLYGELAKWARKALVNGGQLVVMCGQSHLAETMAAIIFEGLTYVWTLAYMTPGRSTQVFGRKVKSNWKPVLWFANGKQDSEHVNDVVYSSAPDKKHHKWGQDVSGFVDLVERFTVKGDLVVDPFCGAGTTGVACLLSGRLFLGIDCDASAIGAAAKRLKSHAAA